MFQVHEVAIDGQLSAEGLRKLCALISTKKSITKLSVVRSGLKGDPAWDPVVVMITARPDMQALNIGFNKLTDKAVGSLCTELSNSQLEVLVMTACRLDRSALPHLSMLIQKSRRLKSLNLDSNLSLCESSGRLSDMMLSPSMCRRYDDDGLGEIVAATYTSESLCFLSLRHIEGVCEEHVEQIEEKLKENRSRMVKPLTLCEC